MNIGWIIPFLTSINVNTLAPSPTIPEAKKNTAIENITNDTVSKNTQPTITKNMLIGNPTIGIPQLNNKSRFFTSKLICVR